MAQESAAQPQQTPADRRSAQIDAAFGKAYKNAAVSGAGREGDSAAAADPTDSSGTGDTGDSDGASDPRNGDGGSDASEPSETDEQPAGEAGADDGGRKAKARRLLSEGKVNAAFAEAFGVPLKQLGLSEVATKKLLGPSFVAFRKREEKLDAQEAQIAAAVKSEQARLEQLAVDTRSASQLLTKEWGGFRDAIEAGKKGDVVAFVEGAAKHAGVTPKAMISAYVQGIKTLGPDHHLRRELDEVKQRLNAPPPPAPVQQQEQPQGLTPEARKELEATAKSQIGSELKKHPIAKIKGFSDLVLNEMSRAIRAKKPYADSAKAADAVLAARKKQAQEDAWLLKGYDADAPTYQPRPRTGTVQSRGHDDTRSREQRREDAIAKIFKGGR